MPRILLPPLARLPRSAWLLLPAMLVATAVLLFPRDLSAALLGAPLPDLPGTVNNWWLVSSGGLHMIEASRWTMFPATIDRAAEMGFPLDAVMATPLLRAFGWPTGFNLAIAMFFCGCGLSAGVLGWRWWGSGTAGIVTGVLYMSSSVWLREIAQGRASHLAGAMFLPIAVMAGVDAVGVARRWVGADRVPTALRWRAWLCGAAMGASALTYWYWGFFALLAVGLVFALAAVERLPVGSFALHTMIGALAVAGIPLIYMLTHLDQHPGVDIGLFDDVVAMGKPDPLWKVLRERSVLGVPSFEGLTALRLGAVGLSLLALWRTPARRIAFPLIALALCWWSACGVLVKVGPIWLPTPYRLVMGVPVLRRLWWPDRFLFVSAVAFAMLAGGGAARLATWLARWQPRLVPVLAPLLCAVILGELWRVQPNLPIPLANPDLDRVAALKTAPGAVMVVPGHVKFGLRPEKGQQIVWDPTLYTDQPWFRKPIVYGNMDPDSTVAPTAYTTAASLPGPGALLACEADVTGFVRKNKSTASYDADSVKTSLKSNRISVFVDYTRASESDYGRAWRECVETLLGPAPVKTARFGIYMN